MNNISLPCAVAEILDRLEGAGFATYVVGGCVRDQLRGQPPHDWDVCTAATPAQMHAVLSDMRLIDTGLQHGTVTAISDGMPIEITTFRTESGYSDGRRPDKVQFIDDVTQDLARRDFTIGAMAYSPTRGLCDPFGGQQDLAQNTLRCVGDADARFTEDALRILRALRFAATDGFQITPETASSLHRQAPHLSQIAPERLREELLRLLCGRFAGQVLRTFRAILTPICPELAAMFDFQQHNAHHLFDVWEHTVRMVEQIPALPVLRMAALLHDSGKPASFTMGTNGVGHFYGHAKESVVLAELLLTRLRFPNQLQADILFLVEQHDRPLGDNPRLIRRRLSRIGEHRFRQLLAVKKADCVGQGTHRENITGLLETETLLEQVLEYENCTQPVQLAVNGNHMLTLGLQGADIGKMLRLLFAHVLEKPEDNDPQILLNFAQHALERSTKYP